MAVHRLAEQGAQKRGQILAYLKSFHAERGYYPTYSEIAVGVGLKSVNGVRQHLFRMQDGGVIQLDPRVARSIRIVE